MLQNVDQGTLTVHQIAEHLTTRPGNVTYELNLGRDGAPGRLRGRKVRGPGIRGRNGQWRVDRDVYLDWLGIPEEDREHLDDAGLPKLVAAELIGDATGTPGRVRILLRNTPHITFGQRRYLTHHQFERLRVLLTEDCREKSR